MLQLSATRFSFQTGLLPPPRSDRGAILFLKDTPSAAGLKKRSLPLSRSSLKSSSSLSPIPPANSVPFSNWVNKIVAHESLSRLILQPSPMPATYMFANVGKVFLWLDFFGREGARVSDPLACIYMKEAFASCHDVNVITRDNLDVCVGKLISNLHLDGTRSERTNSIKASTRGRFFASALFPDDIRDIIEALCFHLVPV